MWGGLGPVSLPPTLRGTGRELPTGDWQCSITPSFSPRPGAACRSEPGQWYRPPSSLGSGPGSQRACAGPPPPPPAPMPREAGLEGLELVLRVPWVTSSP